ncbi:ChaN family lipoprotein [Fulvivirgaceae bacterium LMO-SS25]
MKKIFTLIFTLSFSIFSFAQDLPSYRILDKEGNITDFQQLVDASNEHQVVLFGELHNNAIGHWLQLKLSEAMIEANSNLVFGAEMFESDNQLLMNEYLNGTITLAQFETEGKMWNNFKTDYKPLLDLAKNNNRPFIATNIPRRYASVVNKQGLDGLATLDASAKQYIAPLPFQVDLDLPGYKWMIETMGAHAPGGQSANIAMAQASKDATMAYFILQNLREDAPFIHYHGTFHSNNFEGIYWYLKQANADLKILTIAMVEQADISNLTEENLGLADFIILLPSDSPKSY